MLFIFGYGINLDSGAIKIGLLIEDHSEEAHRFADSFYGSRYFSVLPAQNRQQLDQEIMDGTIRGFVVIQQNFSEDLERPGNSAPVQVVTDGAEPQLAAFVQGYTQGAWQDWLSQRNLAQGIRAPAQIGVQERYWYNPSAESRNFLVPGSITLIMTVVGALLTSLVVAREWERGTMEALLASPMSRTEFLLSKLIPYYVLGILSLMICVIVAVFVLGVPFRGSIFALFLVSTLFLLTTLGAGLLISTLMKNQFNAAQAALNLAFLPSMMFSGFIYEISSMPAPIRAVTYLFPARYFVTCLQTLFQAGDLWPILLRNSLFLLVSGIVLIGLTARFTRKRLD
jgi:ABC-2 type transport system permease protein